MDLIKLGEDKGLITFDENREYIRYVNFSKPRKYTNPEEKVQAETFLKLVLTYNYSHKRIKHYEMVTMGSSKREADIIVYNDDACEKPHIVVECKKEEVSEMEFNQAINQAASYAYAMPGNVKYLLVTSGIKEESFLINKESNVRISIPDIPALGVTEIQRYKYAKGGRREGEDPSGNPIKQKYFELEKVAEEELTRRFKLAHNSLWAGGELNPSEAFDELDKLIFCKIWDERMPRKPGDPYHFQPYNEPIPPGATDGERRRIEEKIAKDLYERILKIYEVGKKKDPEVFKDNIRLNYRKVRTVVGYLYSINLSATDLDSKGKAFETFVGSYFRGDFGQYFTPRKIVEFTVNVLPITHESKVLDTSCGSGGFLLYALDKVRKEASVYYPKQIGDPDKDIPEGKDHYNHWHDFAEKNLYGIEINEQIARTAKMNMIIHDDGHTNVIAADGLLRADPEPPVDGETEQEKLARLERNKHTLQERFKNSGFKYNTFDFIITNPPFGSTIRQVEKAYLNRYSLGNKDVSWLDTKNTIVKGRSSQSTEVLFIEQCHNFLKDGGFLAIVIPDGVLTGSSVQYVRNNIEEWFRIVAVVSLPNTAFSHSGAGVKSSVLFLRKWRDRTTEKIVKTKNGVKTQLKKYNNYVAKVKELEKEKKAIIKEHKGFVIDTEENNRKLIEKTDDFKNWKIGISNTYNQKIKDFKEEMMEQYLEEKQKALDDYQIFMAIADDIGYDATGRETGNNELEVIQKELKKFINHIDKKERL